ncbi:MAG: hypothetical protein M1821_000858 [Bathelium mastoideum]|nr:MAG: hypothetical protein M1821_000858 [Bathelium mastoideum]
MSSNLSISSSSKDRSPSAQEWASLITVRLRRVESSDASTEIYTLPGEDDKLLEAPRRHSANSEDSRLVHEIASIMFPDESPHSLTPLLKYEETIAKIRSLIHARHKAEAAHATERKTRINWNLRVTTQGPWDEHADPVSLRGPPCLPISVTISDEVELKLILKNLQTGNQGRSFLMSGARNGEEPLYGTRFVEFGKAALYEDGRLDLCQVVFGPPHIGRLMDSMRSNESVRHFLLGNNIIGPSGAKEIANFIKDHPGKIETWYLPGNCINESGFKSLVNGLITSDRVTNVWLKHNPLGPWSAHDVFRLITRTPNLRTLNLDETELGDAGVATLFKELTAFAEDNPNQTLPLRNISLIANGIGKAAAAEISRYLAGANCALESLYLSNNPLGDAGAIALAAQLCHNTSLCRLSLQSVGLKDTGAVALLKKLIDHPTLRSLNLGQSKDTKELGSRYNWLTAAAVRALAFFISNAMELQFLNLGYTAIPAISTMPRSTTSPQNPGFGASHATFDAAERADKAFAEAAGGLARVHLAVALSPELLFFSAESLFLSADAGAGASGATKAGQWAARLEERAKSRLVFHMRLRYGIEMNYERFLAEEKRWLVVPEDARKVDHGNRPASPAQRVFRSFEEVQMVTFEEIRESL